MSQRDGDLLWILDFLVDCESTPFATLFSSIRRDADSRLPSDVGALFRIVERFAKAGLLDARSLSPEGKLRVLDESEWERLAQEYGGWLPSASESEVFRDRSGLWLSITPLGRAKWSALPESDVRPAN
jgi:hypothetical protein